MSDTGKLVCDTEASTSDGNERNAGFYPQECTFSDNKNKICRCGPPYDNDDEEESRKTCFLSDVLISTNGAEINNEIDIDNVICLLGSNPEIPWQPSRIKTVQLKGENLKTQELYKSFLSILNKLSSPNFDILVLKAKEINIDTEERLKGVTSLLFEKAIDEILYSPFYALMCKEFEAVKVNTSGNRSVSFRSMVLARCQIDFQNTIEMEQIEVIVEIGSERKGDLSLEEQRLKRRAIGNIRFIGELYKQEMISDPVIIHCIKLLFTRNREITLECVCKLLTTVGKYLENSNVDLQPYFKIMKGIVDNKQEDVSARVRFMLLDVIELRQNNWIPRELIDLKLKFNPKKGKKQPKNSRRGV